MAGYSVAGTTYDVASAGGTIQLNTCALGRNLTIGTITNFGHIHCGGAIIGGSDDKNLLVDIDGDTTPLTIPSAGSTSGYFNLSMTSQKVLGDTTETTPLAGYFYTNEDVVTIGAGASFKTYTNYGIYFLNDYGNTFQGTHTGTKDISFSSYGIVAYEGAGAGGGGSNTDITVDTGTQEFVRSSVGIASFVSVQDTLDNVGLKYSGEYIGTKITVSPKAIVTNADTVEANLYGVYASCTATSIGAGSGVSFSNSYGGWFSGTNASQYNIGIYAIGATAAGIFDGNVNPATDATNDMGVAGINRWNNGYFAGQLVGGFTSRFGTDTDFWEVENMTFGGVPFPTLKATNSAVPNTGAMWQGLYLVNDSQVVLAFALDDLSAYMYQQYDPAANTMLWIDVPPNLTRMSLQLNNLTVGDPTETDGSITLHNITLDYTEWGFLDGIDQSVSTSSNVTFADLRTTTSGTITRDADDMVQSIATSGWTRTYTRNSDGYVSSYTDGTYTWTINRDTDNNILNWTVA
jgi:hypothetical protein